MNHSCVEFSWAGVTIGKRPSLSMNIERNRNSTEFLYGFEEFIKVCWSRMWTIVQSHKEYNTISAPWNYDMVDITRQAIEYIFDDFYFLYQQIALARTYFFVLFTDGLVMLMTMILLRTRIALVVISTRLIVVMNLVCPPYWFLDSQLFLVSWRISSSSVMSVLIVAASTPMVSSSDLVRRRLLLVCVLLLVLMYRGYQHLHS